MHDIVIAIRQLRKSAGFTAVAVISIALGIGANTAIFSLVNEMLLRSLPVSRPDELVLFRAIHGVRGRMSHRGEGPASPTRPPSAARARPSRSSPSSACAPIGRRCRTSLPSRPSRRSTCSSRAGRRPACRPSTCRARITPAIASIVYVTHRDQLSPFRQALERFVMSAWIGGRMDDIGANETLLNRPFDVSVGLAQIKPRTAQTASLLAAGLTARDLPQPSSFDYWDSEPVGPAWQARGEPLVRLPPPFRFPARRRNVADALLDARSNLETCALILALYQRQWEAADPAWSLRQRPEILATLYQIGFARSNPHGAPRSNAFGRRVREVYGQPWLGVFSPAALSGRRGAALALAP